MYRFLCKFRTGESPAFHLYVAKNRISLSSSVYNPIYQKVVFSAKKAVHCSGALLKKRKHYFSYFLNGYRCHKNVNLFQFQALKAIFSKMFIFQKRKKNMQKHFIFKKIRGIANISFRQIRENFGIGRFNLDISLKFRAKFSFWPCILSDILGENFPFFLLDKCFFTCVFVKISFNTNCSEQYLYRVGNLDSSQFC